MSCIFDSIANLLKKWFGKIKKKHDSDTQVSVVKISSPEIYIYKLHSVLYGLVAYNTNEYGYSDTTYKLESILHVSVAYNTDD